MSLSKMVLGLCVVGALSVEACLAQELRAEGAPAAPAPVSTAAAALEPGSEAPAAAAVAFAAGDPLRDESLGTLSLVVSVGERRLHVVRGGTVVKSYPVAVGKPGHPTPRGSFQVRRVIWNPSWVPPRAGWAAGRKPKGPGEPGNPMGKVKMFFREPDYYIHGTEQGESLGTAASHGCIRMSNADVMELAEVVMASGGQPRDRSWFQRVRDRVRRSQEVRLQQPVRLQVRS
jgi:lipoprotein-anchoring transpeptidase ErfK/SrfK